MFETRGRPTSSCQSCRERKRRCDGVVPKCGQCLRMGRACSYPVKQKFAIRNETAWVIKKVGGGSPTDAQPAPVSLPTPQSAHQLSPSSGPVSAAATEGTGTVSSASPTSEGQEEVQNAAIEAQARVAIDVINRRPPIPMASIFSAPICEDFDSMAKRYFINTYSSNDIRPSARYIDYACSLILSGVDQKGVLAHAIRAVGLAALGNRTSQSGILQKSRVCYAQALRMIGRAVSDPAEAPADTTVVSILVASLFETITWSESSVGNWATHMNGAAALIARRGDKQFYSEDGLMIFQEAMGHMLTHFPDTVNHFGQLLPPLLTAMNTVSVSSVPQDDPTWAASRYMVELVAIHQRVQPCDVKRPFSPAIDLPDLERAAEIDHQLEHAFSFMEIPDSWRYVTMRSRRLNPQVVYDGIFHVYHDSYIAKVWNCMRTCRLLAQCIIGALLCRCFGGTDKPWPLVLAGRVTLEDSEGSEKLKAVASTILRLRDEILASVPQMMGYIFHPKDTGLLNQPNGNASGCYFVMWFLYMAGCIMMNTPHTTEWVIQRLRAIRALTGISKAEHLAQLLEDKDRAINMSSQDDNGELPFPEWLKTLDAAFPGVAI
ncbi:hypothetical protein GQ53DRAFT_210883 [Thozetella sp. PMI_491]|nr:hypothetical protein GQ53DRAFT_210883 [Thozetella sp. PMI_491]